MSCAAWQASPTLGGLKSPQEASVKVLASWHVSGGSGEKIYIQAHWVVGRILFSFSLLAVSRGPHTVWLLEAVAPHGLQTNKSSLSPAETSNRSCSVSHLERWTLSCRQDGGKAQL